MPTDFSGNIARFTGFADQYDKYRPTPPAILAEILCQLAQTERPSLVVDLGSGTGLSTRYWANRAEQVIGIEPTPDMRKQAEAQTKTGNISYQPGFSHQTGLPNGCAQIVTCSQALHWMEPQATFEEAARILASGGVFAAYDSDWPPTTSHWEADAAYEACSRQVETLDEKHKIFENVRHWKKNGHLERMRASGCFRYTKEIVVHHVEQGNAGRLVGLFLSQGSVMTLIKMGLSEQELGIDVFRQEAQRLLGDTPQTWFWSSRIRYGIV